MYNARLFCVSTLQVVIAPVFSEEFLNTDASNVHRVDTASVVYEHTSVASTA